MKYIYIVVDRKGKPMITAYESRRKAYRMSDMWKGHNVLRVALIQKKFDRADFVKIVPKKSRPMRKKRKRK